MTNLQWEERARIAILCAYLVWEVAERFIGF